MGRVKLKIKKLENLTARQVTYAKRKHGIIKKAKELSILCDVDVVLLMFSPVGKASLCCGKHSIGEVIAKFAQLTPQERAKRLYTESNYFVFSSCLRLNRKLETLEVSGFAWLCLALKKTFIKLDHDVNIAEFLDRSYWTELEKIDNVDDLQQLENSLRKSLYQIRAHKVNMLQVQHQQDQFMSSECKNQLQNDIDLDFGMEMEQQLESFSWVRNDENMNVPVKEKDPNPQFHHTYNDITNVALKEEDPNLQFHHTYNVITNVNVEEEDPNPQFHHTYNDLTCSASSSLESYSGLFGKSSDTSRPKLETGGIPGTSADPNLQFSNLSFLDDSKLQQLAEWNLLGTPADYYVSQILEASYRPQFGGNWASSETLTTYPVSVFDEPLFSRV
ncbi:hypothetical protein EUTSA_v10018691mg [Eutrema salsugineum]|uniref:MADS-box domain-containing protein n=1 Tax=Eutrema salsugineum TaxID=72664 RepID=V4KEN6_EUTSA|nr:hypothetical protein EUTSA_v10018691mg [Eutrema salsugineum]